MPSYTPPQGKGDALGAQTLYYLKNFTDWLVANGQSGKGMISEVGIPGSSAAATDPIPGSGTGAKYDRRWNQVLHQWFLAANAAGLHVTMWNASNWRVDLRTYENDDGSNKPFNYRTTTTEVTEYAANLSAGGYLRGVNLAGGEFSDQGPGGVLNRSHSSEPNAGYYYPNASDMATIYARGVRIVRIPFRWERLQPTLKGALDTAEMAALKIPIDAAIAAGIVPMIDMHNYARYDTIATGAGGGVYNLGQNAPATHNGATVGGTMDDCYADVWTKIATYFNYIGSTNIIYDIMNEPHDLAGGANDWKVSSRRAVEAIRLVNTTVRIAIEGYTYSTVPDWTAQNGSAWMTQTIPVGQPNAGSARNVDPNIIWNGHHYFDPRTGGFNGGYEDFYDDEVSTASGAGFASWNTGGYVDPYPFNITSQSGLRTTASDSMDANPGAYASPANENGITTGSNTINIPYAAVGNPGNSMRIISSTTSDEGSLRKSLTGALNSRIVQFDFELDALSTISTTADFCIAHLWSNGNSTDLAEIRIIGSGAGYKVRVNTTVTGYPTVTGTAVLSKGAFHSIKFEVTDTAFNIYLDGSGTPDVVFNTANAGVTVNNAGLNVGGIALGKFYGNQALTLYYDNFASGIVAAYDAPPSGGLIAPVTPPPSSNPHGLIGFI